MSVPTYDYDKAEEQVHCHQRKMRNAEREAEPREQDTRIDYQIVSVEAAEAKAFILRYEWLRTAGHTKIYYGARNAKGELVAIATFGAPMNMRGQRGGASASICGETYRNVAVCLERGACAYWAHPHTASWFIPRAVKQAAKDHGWKIFYAYSDPEAGEIGTVYQACNWLYIGQTPDRQIGGKPRERQYFRQLDWPEGKWISSKTYYTHRRLTLNDLRERNPRGQWERKFTQAKHKYVWFEATKQERCAMRAALERKYPVLPYPKRLTTDSEQDRPATK